MTSTKDNLDFALTYKISDKVAEISLFIHVSGHGGTKINRMKYYFGM